MSTDPQGRPGAAPVPPPVVLSDSLASLMAESRALRTDVRTAEAARRRASHISAGVLGLLVIFIGLLLAVTWQNNQLAHQVNRTNKVMVDCTTPGGSCYKEGEVRTGKAIGDIIRAEVFMAECARLYPDEAGPAYDKKLEACVMERLKTQALTPGPPTPSTSPSGTS